MLSQSQKTYKREDALTKDVKKYLDSLDDVYYSKISDRFQKGISDIVACVSGVFVAIELKAEGNTATPHQKLFIKGIVDSGGIGGVCYSLRDVETLVNAAREKYNNSYLQPHRIRV